MRISPIQTRTSRRDKTFLTLNLGLRAEIEKNSPSFFLYIYGCPRGAHCCTLWRRNNLNYVRQQYIDYSSSVLARTAQLLSTLTWLLNRSRSGDPRSFAFSPSIPLQSQASKQDEDLLTSFSGLETRTRILLIWSQFSRRDWEFWVANFPWNIRLERPHVNCAANPGRPALIKYMYDLFRIVFSRAVCIWVFHTTIGHLGPSL